MNCAHDNKVFSGEHHPTTVPQWFYLCIDCGEVGSVTSEKCPQDPDIDSFLEIYKGIDPKGTANIKGGD